MPWRAGPRHRPRSVTKAARPTQTGLRLAPSPGMANPMRPIRSSDEGEATAAAASASLARARTVGDLLDNALRIPGTNVRVGLDPLVGLIPGFGDLVGGLASAYI